jgi:hypothetical protein
MVPIGPTHSQSYLAAGIMKIRTVETQWSATREDQGTKELEQVCKAWSKMLRPQNACVFMQSKSRKEYSRWPGTMH